MVPRVEQNEVVHGAALPDQHDLAAADGLIGS
jgi:hypothetical protein